MDLLAFVTFMFCLEEDRAQCVFQQTLRPTDCRIVGDRVSALAEAEGLAADYYCAYTSAPAASMRPVARPVRTET